MKKQEVRTVVRWTADIAYFILLVGATVYMFTR
jgi:hypothetical protein